MRALNKKNNRIFISIYTILAVLLICSFCLLQKIDFNNMINNGFISNEAIVFILKDEMLHLENIKGNYLLFQFNKTRNENVKSIRIKGDVSLPPIEFSNTQNKALKENMAIVGSRIKKEEIHRDYSIVGEFHVKNNYKLLHEVWIVTTSDTYYKERGQHFIFQSPNKGTREDFKTFLQTQSAKVIQLEQVGTYASKGNQLVIVLIKTMSFFLLFVLFVAINRRLNAEKDKLHIVHLWGMPFKRIAYKVFIAPLFLQLASLFTIVISFYYVSDQFIELWSNEWLYKFIVSSGVLILYTAILSSLFLYFFTVKRGGRKI